jgi:hypothetical protein
MTEFITVTRADGTDYMIPMEEHKPEIYVPTEEEQWQYDYNQALKDLDKWLMEE